MKKNVEEMFNWSEVRNFVIEGVACQPPSSLKRLQATPPLQTSLIRGSFRKGILSTYKIGNLVSSWVFISMILHAIYSKSSVLNIKEIP